MTCTASIFRWGILTVMAPHGDKAYK